jgi:hypothetical protein
LPGPSELPQLIFRFRRAAPSRIRPDSCAFPLSPAAGRPKHSSGDRQRRGRGPPGAGRGATTGVRTPGCASGPRATSASTARPAAIQAIRAGQAHRPGGYARRGRPPRATARDNGPVRVITWPPPYRARPAPMTTVILDHIRLIWPIPSAGRTPPLVARRHRLPAFRRYEPQLSVVSIPGSARPVPRARRGPGRNVAESNSSVKYAG